MTLSCVWADDIVIDLDQVDLIEGVLPLKGMSVMYADSNTGKTFAAIDIACHVATNRPWLNKDVEQGIVLYIAAEAPDSVKRRLWAWKKLHGVEHLPVVVVQSSIDLLNGDTAAVITAIKLAEAKHGKRVILTVIDTLSRSMTGNENAPDDMGKYVASCGAIREATETHVMVIHHCGKDAARGARGHSSLRAATDVEIELTKFELPGGGQGIAFRMTKVRDDAPLADMALKLEVVELGENRKGRTITTCVAMPAEAPKPKPKDQGKQKEKSPYGLTPKQEQAVEWLELALEEHGEPAPTDHPLIPPGGSVVHYSKWVDTALRFIPGEKPDWRKRDNFKTMAESIMAKGAVTHVEGYCWLPSETSETSENIGIPRSPRVEAPSKGTSDSRPRRDPVYNRVSDAEVSEVEARENSTRENDNSDLNAPGFFDDPQPLARRRLASTPAPVDPNDISDLL